MMTSIQSQRTQELEAPRKEGSALTRAFVKATCNLSALLIGLSLLSTTTQAANEQTSLVLKYKVFDAEAIYAVTTAQGELEVFNRGPGSVRVRWIDPITKKEAQQVLGDEEALFTGGQLGAEVRQGTLVFIEKIDASLAARGVASLPTNAALVQALKSHQTDSGLLPWHRGHQLNLNGSFGLCDNDTVIMQLGDTGDPTPLGFFSRGLFNTGYSEDDSTELIDLIVSLLGTSSFTGGAKYVNLDESSSLSMRNRLEHGPGLHDGFSLRLGLLQTGYTLSFRKSNKPAFILGIPSCPEFLGSILAPYFHSQGEASASALLGAIWQIPGLEHGPGLHDSTHCFILRSSGNGQLTE